MHARFFVPRLAPVVGATVDLPADESAHLALVLRARPGEVVHLFDGRGGEYAAAVEVIDRRAARVRLLEPVAPRAEPRARLTLAQAVLKGDGFDRVVRDVTMAGAAGIRPILTSRTEVSASARARRIDRWSRIAVSAAKQCGRATLPAIDAPADLGTWLETDRTPVRILLAEPGVECGVSRLDALRMRPPPEAALLVGPEGGWSVQELDLLLSHGVVPLSLGSLTFRAEVAALVAIAALLTAWDAW